VILSHFLLQFPFGVYNLCSKLSDRNGDIHARNATNFGVQMGNRSFDGHHDNDDDDELPAGS